VTDPRYAIKAMRLTAAQEAGLSAVRARYRVAIQGYVARLNALQASGVPRSGRLATEDTLRKILVAERTAADSLLTTDQKQRFQNAIREMHAATVINPVDVKAARAEAAAKTSAKTSAKMAVGSSSVVPIP
jgi:hypothetical protein